MTNYRFWQSWPAGLRNTYLLLLGVVLFTMGWSVWQFLFGPDAVYPWLTEPEFTPLPFSLDRFTRLLHPFDVNASGFLLTEKFQAGLLQWRPAVIATYLFLLALALVVYLAAVSTLSRLPYVVGMLLFMLFAAQLNIDLLDLLPGAYHNTSLIILLALYGLLTYYFQAFREHTSFPARLLWLALLTAVLGGAIFWRADLHPAYTALHLVSYSSGAVVGAALLFSLLVGIDNVAALLWLNGQNESPASRPGLTRFVLSSVLYLGLLLLVYLSFTHAIDLNISFFSPFFLLAVSFFTGLWGFRQREQAWGAYLPFRPAGAFLYLSLAMMAFLCAGLAFATYNDSMVEAFNDIVVFSHLALGFLFFLYVLVNFAPLLHKRLRAYKVVYEPRRIPFYISFGAGLIVVIMLAARTEFLALQQTYAGYYNYVGDLYAAQQNDLLAQRYYTEGNVYDNDNPRSNLSLADLAALRGFAVTEANFLKRALARKKDEKTYLRFANLFTGQQAFFEALYLLREGAREYPKSYRIRNNIALLFSRTNVLDSMAVYLDQAGALSDDPVVRNNTLGLLLQTGFVEEARQQLAKTKAPDYLPYRSNALLLQTATGVKNEQKELPAFENRELDAGRFALLYHHVLSRLPEADSVTVEELDTYLREPANTRWAENLTFLKALVLHYHTNRIAARELLEALAHDSPGNDGYYLDLLGLWSLQEENYAQAADFFERAKAAGYATAFLHHAAALALAGEPAAGAAEARKAMLSDDPALVREAVQLTQLLQSTPASLPDNAPDSLRARLVLLYLPLQPLEASRQLLERITNPEARQAAAVALTEEYLQRGQIAEAERLLAQVEAAPEALSLLQAQRLVAKRDFEGLLAQLPQFRFRWSEAALQTYYRALALVELGRVQEAAPLVRQFPQLLPYHAEALQLTARYYNEQKQPLEAYEVLRQGTRYNPYSVPLLKAFMLQAASVNLEKYTDMAREMLQQLVTAPEYRTFITQYEQRVAQKAAQDSIW